MKSKNTKSIKNTSGTSAKKVKYRGKQVLVVGLVALVLAAGYYRWTLDAVRSDAVSVSSTAAPEENTADTETNVPVATTAPTGGTESTDGAESSEAAFWPLGGDDDSGEEQDTDSESSEGDPAESGVSDSAGANVAAQSRQDRDKLRGETLDTWKQIASNKDASENAKKEAEDNIVKLTGYSESENAIETAVKTKGFEDCFAMISDSGVSVIVKGGELSGESVAQIKDIIITETGVAASQIKISSE